MSLAAPPGSPDSDGMWAVTAALPEQVEAARDAARRVSGLPSADGVANVVVLGMGGSGIAGDVLAAVAIELTVPLTVCKDYDLPAFVGPSSLVFASSFSGNTEETLAAARAAASRGARLVAVTAGGALRELVAGCGGTVVPVAPAIPHPRAAIGALAVPPLVVLGRLGLLSEDAVEAEVAAAITQLRVRRDQITAGVRAGVGAGARPGVSTGRDPAASDPAAIAKQLARTIPLIHGGGPLGSAAAARWKCQINENPKSPAFASTQPELCHNEITGWGQLGDVTRQLVSLVLLRHSYEHPQVERRFALVADLMDEVVAEIVEVRAAGAGRLAQFFDLVLVGDVVALELAALEGIDPGPIPILTELKAALEVPTS